MTPVVILLGSSLAVFFLTLWRGCHRHSDAVYSAAMLTLSAILGLFIYKLNIVWAYVPMDFFMGAIVLRMYQRSRRVWKYALCLLFLADLTIHAVYQVVIPPTRISWFYYALCLNGIYALQLAAVASGGVGQIGAAIGTWWAGRFRLSHAPSRES